MAQTDSLGAVANVAGATYRQIVNLCQQALATMNSGAAAPSVTYDGMFWWDTSTNIIKLRNKTNTAWVNMAYYDGVTIIPYLGGSRIDQIATRKSNLSAIRNPVGTDDTSQGYSVGSLWLNISSGDFFICASSSAGAADWSQITNAPVQSTNQIYNSTAAAFGLGNRYTYSHGLPSRPQIIQATLTCVSNDQGYVVGNKLVFSSSVADFHMYNDQGFRLTWAPIVYHNNDSQFSVVIPNAQIVVRRASDPTNVIPYVVLTPAGWTLTATAILLT